MTFDELLNLKVSAMKQEVKKELLDEILGNMLLTTQQSCERFNISRNLLYRLRLEGILIPDQERPLRFKYSTVKRALEHHHNTKNSYTRLT